MRACTHPPSERTATPRPDDTSDNIMMGTRGTIEIPITDFGRDPDSRSFLNHHSRSFLIIPDDSRLDRRIGHDGPRPRHPGDS